MIFNFQNHGRLFFGEKRMVLFLTNSKLPQYIEIKGMLLLHLSSRFEFFVKPSFIKTTCS